MKHSITDPSTEAVKSPEEFARETFRLVPKQLSRRQARKLAKKLAKQAVNDALVAADQAEPSRLDRFDRQADHNWTPEELDRLTAELFQPHATEVEFEPYCSICGEPAILVANEWEHLKLDD